MLPSNINSNDNYRSDKLPEFPPNKYKSIVALPSEANSAAAPLPSVHAQPATSSNSPPSRTTQRETVKITDGTSNKANSPSSPPLPPAMSLTGSETKKEPLKNPIRTAATSMKVES